MKICWIIYLTLLVYIELPNFVASHCLATSDNSTSSFFPNCKIEYSINPKTLCNEYSPTLLIGVHSSPRNFIRRELIRNTYGSFKRLSNQNIQVVFIIGALDNSTLQNQIENESEAFDDIVQANFKDSYRNLTLKHVALLNWVSEHCNKTSYFVKVDDDTMVDIFHLVSLVETYDFQTDYLCKAIHVVVNRFGKWAVTKEEYNGTVYPDYCEGFAYLFRNGGQLSDMVKVAMRTRFFWIDDVVVSGIVRQEMKLRLRYFPNNFGFTDINLVSKVDLANFMFFRNEANNVNATVWYNVWSLIVVNTYDLFI